MIITFSSLVSAVEENGQKMAKNYNLCVLDLLNKFSMIRAMFNFFRFNY